MTILNWIIQWFFTCRHRDLSRVFTIDTRTYQVCFDCGRRIDYSWERMRSLKPCDSANRLVPLDSRRPAQASIT
jgi:hypothetical protein